jgi:phospholipid/cholesterol/gamma-HCH transport system substrate-binding protein
MRCRAGRGSLGGVIHVPLLLLVLACGCTSPEPGFTVTAEFSDVLDLVPGASVKVNDVSAGSVEAVSLKGWTAVVSLRVRGTVTLPDNATAAIRQTSLLGEKFVALSAPAAGEQPQGQLSEGDLIPLSRTKRAAEVEEVLAALGLVLNGGGLANLRTINVEVVQALAGREEEARDALSNLDTFVAGLDAQKAGLVRALDALDRLSASLAEQREAIGAAVEALDPGLSALAEQRTQLVEALQALDSLSGVGTKVISASQEDLLAQLRALQPLLDQLVEAGDNLPRAVDFLLTFPFPPNATRAINGGKVNLHATVDLDAVTFLAQSLVAPPDGSLLPALPSLPSLPPLPLPSLPPLPLPSLPPLPLPTPSLPLPPLPLPLPSFPWWHLLAGGLRG